VLVVMNNPSCAAAERELLRTAAPRLLHVSLTERTIA
jgi:hypothetical protein